MITGSIYDGKAAFFVGRYVDLKEETRKTKVLTPGLVAQVQVRVLQLYGRDESGGSQPVRLWVTNVLQCWFLTYTMCREQVLSVITRELREL